MKPRWKDGRLDLGRLGRLEAYPVPIDGWNWCWRDEFTSQAVGSVYKSEAAAQRAAVRWLRAALKQAARRVGP